MKILLVDDDKFFLALTCKALKMAGYEVIVASDGCEAGIKMRENSLDLIITDIFMPNKDGLEVIQESKEINPKVKVIAITSGGTAGHYSSFLQIAEAFGSDGSLQKPFTSEELLEKIS